jgi:hypothetical protein
MVAVRSQVGNSALLRAGEHMKPLSGGAIQFIMTVLLWAFLIFFAWAIGLSFFAQAQTACAPKSDMIAALAKKYGEAAMLQGTIGEVRLMKMFVGPSGSWTILEIDAEGLACVVAAGGDLERAATAIAGNPS